MSGIALLRRLLMKQAMKKSAPFQHEGIMSINKNLVNDVETQVKKWVDSAKRQGADIDKMSEQELKYVIELNKPKPVKAISADSPEGKQFTKGLMNMLNKASGENVIKTDFGKPFAKEVGSVDGTIKYLKTLEPMDSMKEANKVLKGEGRYKSLSQADRKKIVDDESVTDHIFERNIEPDPEDLAHGGRTGTGLNYLLGEDDQNSRVPFGKGKLVDAARRKFLKWAGAGAATAGAAKSGLFGLLKGGGKKQIIKDLTSVPIKSGVDGMPVWFKPLVNKVIREGDDVTKKFATKEREIVHTKKIDDVDEVTVTQDLDTGNVTVEYGYHLTDDTGKVIRASNDPEVIHLEYRAAEEIPLKGKKGSIKTKEEFSAVESEPEVVNWDGDIEMSGVNEVNKIDDLITDTTKLETYATGNKPNIKKLLKSEQKQKYKNKLETDTTEAINYIEKKHGPFPDPGDYSGGKDSTIKAFDDYYGKASGGRVPLGGGGIALKILKF